MSEVLRYIDPPERVTSGRRLGSWCNHSVLMEELDYGEHLYAYIDRYIFKQARLVDDVREFDDVFGVVGDDDKHVTTLNIVLHLLKSLQANEMLADGTSYTDSE